MRRFGHGHMTGMLEGIRVLEIANWVAAPSACAILADLGADVIQAFDGTQGLRLALEGRFDLIILDVTMPGVDGLTVCSHLKKSELSSAIPILMLTARSDVEDINKAMAAGADDYLVKPYDPGVLQAKIQRHIGDRKAGSRKGKGST